jgi:hypothetical protein
MFLMMGMTKKFNQSYSIIIAMFLTWIIDMYLLVIFPMDIGLIAATYFLSSLFSSWRAIIVGTMINSFPLNGLSGMFLTMLASLSNFGKFTSIHTKLIVISFIKTKG